jgi:hypothetical protein
LCRESPIFADKPRFWQVANSMGFAGSEALVAWP